MRLPTVILLSAVAATASSRDQQAASPALAERGTKVPSGQSGNPSTPSE